MFFVIFKIKQYLRFVCFYFFDILLNFQLIFDLFKLKFKNASLYNFRKADSLKIVYLFASSDLVSDYVNQGVMVSYL